MGRVRTAMPDSESDGSSFATRKPSPVHFVHAQGTKGWLDTQIHTHTHAAAHAHACIDAT